MARRRGSAEMCDVPLLLLHGMMLDGRVFAAQIRALGEGRQVFVADLSGASTIDGMAARVLSSAPSVFAVAGLSMGGIVAPEIWRRARVRISHVALLDTTPFADKPQRRELRSRQIAAVERGKLREVLIESMKPLYLARRNRGNRALLDLILAMGIAAGPDTFRRQSLALRNRADSQQTRVEIARPSLVLCGREDLLGRTH